MSSKKPQESIEKLVKTMRVLRGSGGCPWDIEQTPESLAPYILEEACELIDAIETGDEQLILDELGDLLLQVVFQAQIFSENGTFDFTDVAESINAKLIRRHPHVFSTSHDNRDDNDLDRQWDSIKSQEEVSQKVHQTKTGQLPSRLPALQYTQKLISRTIRAGLQHRLPVNFPQALPTDPQIDGKEYPLDENILGHKLLQLLIEAQKAGIDAEQTLRKTARQLQIEIESFDD